MKPCDVKDEYSAKRYLNEQGLAFGSNSIEVRPCSVILTIGSCTIRIPQIHFKRFAEWYLEEQILEVTKGGM